MRRLRAWAPGLCGVVAVGAVVLAWQESVPEITAAEAVEVADGAFGAAGVEVEVEGDPSPGTYAPSSGDPIAVWTVRATVRANPVVVLLARSGAQPLRIDDRTTAGTEYILTKDEYAAVAGGVDDPARDRTVRRNIALTVAAVLVVALAIAHRLSTEHQPEGDDVTDARGALIAHLLEHSVRTGDFTLKSGRRSGWFIDAKQTTCRPEGILLVAEAALEVIPVDATAIGGLTMGADAVAFGIAAIAATRGRRLRSFSVRKEVKDHGGGGRVAGALQPGDKVVITEDAVTRGVSMLEAAEVVRQAGAEPVLLLPVVDRGGTVETMAADQGLPLHALVTALDLGFPYEGP